MDTMTEFASADEFDTDLSEVANWYSLGVHLHVPTNELDKISLAYHHEGHSRCLIEVHKYLSSRGQADQSLSWNHIVRCLRTMGYHGLADKIYQKRVSPYLFFQQMPLSQQDIAMVTTCAVEAKLEVIEIKDDKIDVVATEFLSLFEQCSSVKLQVERTFKSSNVCLTDVTCLVRDQSGLALHPQATFDDIFRKLHNYCSVLNFRLIKFLVTELLPNDKALVELVTSFNDSIERFKNCVKMSQLAELIKNQQQQPAESDVGATMGGQKKIVKLKVRKIWEDYTIKQFEEAAGKILRIIHGVMLLVEVESGCMCVTWIVPDEIDTDNLIQSKLSYEFVKIIGVMYLTIGDEIIYRVKEPDGCETMEAAILQAIELRNTQAIELFLSLGYNPAVATHSSTTTAVTNIVNIVIEPVECDERPSSTAVEVNHVCVLGHNSHVQAIVDSSANDHGPSVDSLSEADTDITSGLGEETIDARLSELDTDGDSTSIEVIKRYKIFAGHLWKEKILSEKKLSTEKEIKNKLYMELEQSKESQIALKKELELIKAERLSIHVYDSKHLLEQSEKVSEWRRYRAITIEDTCYILQSFCDEVDSSRLSEGNSVLLEKFEFMCTKGLQRKTFNSQDESIFYYAICHLGKDIYFFGGSSKPDSCFHNSLMKFNIDTLTLRSVLPSSEDLYNAPIKKHGCGMITLKSEDQNFLVTFGGAGNTPPPLVLPTLEAHAKYISCQQKPHICYTNEVWMTCLSTLSGKWSRCEVVGNFDPRVFFSADTLPDNRGIVFGGQIIVGDRFERSDDVFLVSLNKRKIIFSRAIKSSRLQAWPPKRYHHASTVIISLTDSGETQQNHLVILGGCNDKVISDCWIMNIGKNTWQKIELPDNVTCRQKHSLSSFSLGPNLVWLLVYGGYKKGSDSVSIQDSFVIVTLGFNSRTGVWYPVGKPLTYKEIETLQYQQFLSESLIESTKLLQEWKSKQKEIVKKEELRRQELKRERKFKQEELKKKDDLVKKLKKDIKILENQRSEEAQKSERELKFMNEGAEKTQKELNEKLSKTLLNFNNIAQELEKNVALLKQKEQEKQELLESNERLKMQHEIVLAKSMSSQQLDVTLNTHDSLVEETAFETDDAKLKEFHKSAKQEMQYKKNFQKPMPQWIVDKKEIEIFHESVLGKGSYGTVHTAKFRGTLVAAKSIHNHPGIKGSYGGVFFREMDISSQIHHPNIVQFIAAATDGEVPVLLYELMTTNLHKKLHSSDISLELNEVLRVTIDVLSALAYLHGWKPDAIIHRDVSSSNVLMEPCGANKWRSKLSDFGSANLQRHTKTQWPGNVFYAAPEAENPKLHTTSMDIYSLGVLIMEMNIKTPALISAERFEKIGLMTFVVLKPIVERCMADTNTDRPETNTLLCEVTSLLVEEEK